MDDFVLSLGEAHIGVVPVSPAHIGIKDEQIMGLAEAGEAADLAVSSKRLTLDQNLHATSLVDEVDGASIEREAFPGAKSVASKNTTGRLMPDWHS